MAAALPLLGCLLSGCPRPPSPDAHADPTTAALRVIDLNDPIRPQVGLGSIRLRAARNEWTSFTLQITHVFASTKGRIHVTAPTSFIGGSLAGVNLQAYQILPMPIGVNPGYVRHTGLTNANRSMPQALLPVPVEAGAIWLGNLRDPTQPTNPDAHPDGHAILLWVDLHVPADAAAGDYTLSCELQDSRGRPTGPAVPVQLAVHDFAIPDQRHLQMVGQVHWERLESLFPESFGEAVTPNLISRREPRYAGTVGALDAMMVLGEQNGASLVIPELRPTVKWPGGGAPRIDWREFDGLIAPWMRGELFADRQPLAFWPIPPGPDLDRYDLNSRAQYWKLAAAHFQQLDWLARSAVLLHNPSIKNPDDAAARELAGEAASVLQANPQVRVALPFSEDQVKSQPLLAAPDELDRIVTAAPLLISAAPPSSPGRGADHPHWLRADLPGMRQSAGIACDEPDVRVWAWLAFLRHADLVLWDNALPAADSATDAADPCSMIWFYPGRWFGVRDPVPTIQLKWLRRAEQDYEYLRLAEQAGEAPRAMEMARLMTRPIELPPGQPPDPRYELMSGTSDPSSWGRALALLAQTILMHRPGQAVDAEAQQALSIETMQWSHPQERPLLIPREVRWIIDKPSKAAGGAAIKSVSMQLGLGIYNAGAVTPEKNALEWSAGAGEAGWEAPPQAVEVPPLLQFQVQPATLKARIDLERITAASSKPLELSFVNGFTRVASPMKVRIPIAVSDRRDRPLTLDGRLDDWTDAEAIQDGPLVRMMSRPALQSQQLQSASTPAKVFSAWDGENLYVAFALNGLSPDPHEGHNDVDYQARRAWNEDLCELLIQPIYSDNQHGPVLHVVCKPGGGLWVEGKSGSSTEKSGWQPSGAAVRYATATLSGGRWRGEIAIPWNAINDPARSAPVLLRFNFSQYRQANCESASWCGPVDFGRDDRMTGALYLRTPRDLRLADWPAASRVP